MIHYPVKHHERGLPGGSERVGPISMTATAIIGGLLPIMRGGGYEN